MCCFAISTDGQDDGDTISKHTTDIDSSKKSLQNLRRDMAEEILKASGIARNIELIC